MLTFRDIHSYKGEIRTPILTASGDVRTNNFEKYDIYIIQFLGDHCPYHYDILANIII